MALDITGAWGSWFNKPTPPARPFERDSEFDIIFNNQTGQFEGTQVQTGQPVQVIYTEAIDHLSLRWTASDGIVTEYSAILFVAPNMPEAVHARGRYKRFRTENDILVLMGDGDWQGQRPPT